MMIDTPPTPYPEINALLETLLARLQAILEDEFVGLYIYGSLASGDFNPLTSDIDFLAVTSEPLPEATVVRLGEMHAALWQGDNPWAQRMEAAYIPLYALRRYDPANSTYPHLGSDGHFGVEWHESGAVIQRWMLLDQGIALAGPPLDTLIDPISPDELRAAVASLLEEWWRPRLEDPSILQADEYRAYAVQTLCRMLYTREHGAVISKYKAARWAQENLEPPWRELAKQALLWRDGGAAPELAETLAFIRYTLGENPP
jgi:hypothetical protein